MCIVSVVLICNTWDIRLVCCKHKLSSIFFYRFFRGTADRETGRIVDRVVRKSRRQRFFTGYIVCCAGYEDRIKADIKCSQSEVKASKSVKRFQRYRQLKFSMFYLNVWGSPGLCPLNPHSNVQFMHKYRPMGLYQAQTF